MCCIGNSQCHLITGGFLSVPLHLKWHGVATGCGCAEGTCVILPQGMEWWGKAWDLGARKRVRPRLRRLQQPLAPALQEAGSSASQQLSSLHPLSHPQPLSSCAENVFVLFFVFTNGCGGREWSWYFVFSSSRSSALIDTCQVWNVAETLWAECINVCRGKKRAGWFCFNNKIKVPLKFTHGPRNKHDKLQPRG